MTEQYLPAKATAVGIPMRQFLEQAAAFKPALVELPVESRGGNRWAYKLPQIWIYCDQPPCQSDKFFDCKSGDIEFLDVSKLHVLERFVKYRCRHCQKTVKTFALRIVTPGHLDTEVVEAMKYGEDPAAIGKTPRALQTLLDDQWELFLQGRRSELAGLGIGAFIYYRRVVEHIWTRVLARLHEVSWLDLTPERREAIEAAQSESRFTESMNLALVAVPPSLFIEGHNPFQRLYDACGDAVHEHTDEQCLARARIIRLVLSKFCERAESVLATDSELNQAVGQLVNLGSKDTNS